MSSNAPQEINTHNVEITFGKHKGTLVTRLPVSYLKWMMNEAGMSEHWKKIAKSEFERRGDTMPTVELSGHAIDNASLRIRKIWHENRGQDEGLYTWLMRMTLEALEKGEKIGDDRYLYLDVKWVIVKGAEFPLLKTVMR